MLPLNIFRIRRDAQDGLAGFWGAICLRGCSPPLRQAHKVFVLHQKVRLLKSHGMQVEHQPWGSLGGMGMENSSSWWKVRGGVWGKEPWNKSCAAGGGDLAVQPLLDQPPPRHL